MGEAIMGLALSQSLDICLLAAYGRPLPRPTIRPRGNNRPISGILPAATWVTTRQTSGESAVLCITKAAIVASMTLETPRSPRGAVRGKRQRNRAAQYDPASGKPYRPTGNFQPDNAVKLLTMSEAMGLSVAGLLELLIEKLPVDESGRPAGLVAGTQISVMEAHAA